MMVKESMAHTTDASKSKYVKDFGEHAASSWAWEELWGIHCSVEEEIPPPWVMGGGSKDVSINQLVAQLRQTLVIRNDTWSLF